MAKAKAEAALQDGQKQVTEQTDKVLDEGAEQTGESMVQGGRRVRHLELTWREQKRRRKPSAVLATESTSTSAMVNSRSGCRHGISAAAAASSDSDRRFVRVSRPNGR